jgi:hypothetical protein
VRGAPSSSSPLKSRATGLCSWWRRQHQRQHYRRLGFRRRRRCSSPGVTQVLTPPSTSAPLPVPRLYFPCAVPCSVCARISVRVPAGVRRRVPADLFRISAHRPLPIFSLLPLLALARSSSSSVSASCVTPAATHSSLTVPIYFSATTVTSAPSTAPNLNAQASYRASMQNNEPDASLGFSLWHNNNRNDSVQVTSASHRVDLRCSFGLFSDTLGLIPAISPS